MLGYRNTAILSRNFAIRDTLRATGYEVRLAEQKHEAAICIWSTRVVMIWAWMLCDRRHS